VRDGHRHALIAIVGLGSPREDAGDVRGRGVCDAEYIGDAIAHHDTVGEVLGDREARRLRLPGDARDWHGRADLRHQPIE